MEAAARGTPLPPEDLSGCEVCEIESFRTGVARTAHFMSTKHVTAVHLAAGGDGVVPGCDICKYESFSTHRARESHLLSKCHLAAVERREKRLSEEVEGCEYCGNERFRSEAVKAAHLLTQAHLDAVERAERREQRRLGHRVQGRTNKARVAREDRTAREDFVAVGTYRVGRAPKREVPAPSPPSSERIAEAPGGPVLTITEVAPPSTTPPITAPQPPDLMPEAPMDQSTGRDASDTMPEITSSTAPEDAAADIESAPGPSERTMIVAETTASLLDREMDGYSDDHPGDDFVTYLLSRFSDPQKIMFVESYGVYMREDMRNSFCIDLDEAFEWLGYTRKSKAVELLKRNLIEGQDFALPRSVGCEISWAGVINSENGVGSLLKMADPKFKHCSEAARAALGYKRKSALVRILRRDYQRDVDWVCISGPKRTKGGNAPQNYYITDECLRLLGYRCSSRCVSRPSQPIKLGEYEVHHIKRYHPKEEELMGFLMRAYSRSHSCRVQHCVGPYRVDMVIDNRIVVECDEDNHAGYDAVREAERHNFLERRGYTLYRFDCDSPTFDLATVIADLNDLLNSKC
jgi:very-short-patch-repair endonuclease